MRLKAKVQSRRGAFLQAFTAKEAPLARAATKAIDAAAGEVKVGARAQIAGAGFSQKWQNALRVDRYPKGSETSINAAAHVYHKIGYAGVFEEGATIRGAPHLWLPLPSAPQKIGRFRMTPKRYPGPLQFIRRPGRPPLLVAPIGMSRAAARRDKVSKVSLATARKGTAAGGKNRVVRSVPMFVGIPTVKLRRRFNITGIVEQASAKLGELYLRHLRDDD